MRSWCALLAAACAAPAAPPARAADFCASCEIQLGIGGTYHYWGYTHSLVVPLALNFDRDRWELAAFRFASHQEFYDTTFNWWVRPAEAYWGFSLTRRLELFRHPHWRGIVGLGASYKTEGDRLSSSLWHFAEQVGGGITPPPGGGLGLLGRHRVNAGLRAPNHGPGF